MGQTDAKLLKAWMLSKPCVLNGTVKVDVRGPWPIAIIGLKATQIEEPTEFVDFVLEGVN